MDDKMIQEAVRRLLDVAPAGAKVILFGSHARGDERHDSDVDFLIVEPVVRDHVAEIARLVEALRPLKIPADVMVISEEKFNYWRETPNTIVHRALKEGRLYESVA